MEYKVFITLGKQTLGMIHGPVSLQYFYKGRAAAKNTIDTEDPQRHACQSS
jgi:hypothetical protein